MLMRIVTTFLPSIGGHTPFYASFKLKAAASINRRNNIIYFTKLQKPKLKNLNYTRIKNTRYKNLFYTLTAKRIQNEQSLKKLH